MNRKKQYRINCVASDEFSIRNMIDSARDITRATFVKHVDADSLHDLERELGYSSDSRRGLTMANDWGVSYHKGRYKNADCVYFRWSSIEYIFV
jgi:hypothetical protein